MHWRVRARVILPIEYVNREFIVMPIEDAEKCEYGGPPAIYRNMRLIFM